MKLSKKRYTEPDYPCKGTSLLVRGQRAEVIRLSTIRRSGWTDAYIRFVDDASTSRHELGYVGKRVDDARHEDDA